MKYRMFDICLDSAIPLPDLPEYHTDGTDLPYFTIAIQQAVPVAETCVKWFHHWKSASGQIIVSAGRNDSGFRLRFPKLVDYQITDNGRRVCAYPRPEVPDSTVRHLLLDQVIPRILGQRGRLVLHAGAVALEDNGAVGIVGASGWGKSTLVSSFHQHGAPLITDDCLLIKYEDKHLLGVANYPGIRLFADSADAVFGAQRRVSQMAHYSTKQRVLMDTRNVRDNVNASRLNALFFLNDPGIPPASDGVTVSPVRGMKELMTLIGQVFLLDVGDKKLMGKQFQHCGNIIDSGLPIFKLCYPRVHHMLPEVRQAVKNAMTGNVAVSP